MEREGIYYFFEQGDDGGEARHHRQQVVPGRRSTGEPVRFFALGGHDAQRRARRSTPSPAGTARCPAERHAQGLRLHQAHARRLRQRAGRRRRASARSASTASASSRPTTASASPELRAEELLARQVVYRGAGTALYLRAGYIFKLEDHPRPASTRQYLVIEVEHSGNQAIADARPRARSPASSATRSTGSTSTAIPAERRSSAPSARPPWPRIYGFENGIVDGPAESEYAQIDDARALQRQVQVRRERSQGRQGVDLGADDAAARRRHRGLPLPAAQGDRGALHLPRRRPRPAR